MMEHMTQNKEYDWVQAYVWEHLREMNKVKMQRKEKQEVNFRNLKNLIQNRRDSNIEAFSKEMQEEVFLV